PRLSFSNRYRVRTLLLTRIVPRLDLRALTWLVVVVEPRAVAVTAITAITTPATARRLLRKRDFAFTTPPWVSEVPVEDPTRGGPPRFPPDAPEAPPGASGCAWFWRWANRTRPRPLRRGRGARHPARP